VKNAFISHASADKDLAAEICAMLEKRGISCWIAPRDIVPGKDYGEQIIFGIEEAAATVLVLSENANNSTFVRKEIERAVSKGKAIFPVRVRNVQPSKGLELFISSAHWIEAWQSPIDAMMDQLAAAIGALISPSTSKNSSGVADALGSKALPGQAGGQKPAGGSEKNFSNTALRAIKKISNFAFDFTRRVVFIAFVVGLVYVFLYKHMSMHEVSVEAQKYINIMGKTIDRILK
jgi:hypothetical protein